MAGREIQLFKQYEAKTSKLTGLVGKLLQTAAALYPGAAVGREGDMLAALFPFSRNPSTQVTDYRRHILYTYLVILFPEPLDFEFQIVNAKPPKGLFRKVFGKHIVETGTNIEFDNNITASSGYRNQLSALLRDNELREKILELYRLPWNCRITEEGIRMMKKQEIVSLQEALSARNSAAETARRISASP